MICWNAVWEEEQRRRIAKDGGGYAAAELEQAHAVPDFAISSVVFGAPRCTHVYRDRRDTAKAPQPSR
jgi:hypothetical protein